ncbi:NnrU family protein [Flexibacterium corallicola]|uniref:NnrU family protein n=1 Tax=Flexibacterium corallicola TaxID=3037259 RepID=UPI00286F4F90|nr:NnrU family protein [Pseudovibrio sp. M1P-2-3]
MDWLEYIAAFGAFFVLHQVPTRPPMKARLVALVGSRGFTALYSALSLGILWWLFAAAQRAPYVEIWQWQPWQNGVPLVAMALVCVLIALAVGRPNPFSFGGAQNEQFNVEKPGIVKWMRHPLLVALAIWATAHMVPNGDLAHILVFGSFAAFALLGQRLVDRKKQREMGARWGELRDALQNSSVSISSSILPRVSLGLGAFAGLLWLHQYLFGVSPIAIFIS